MHAKTYITYYYFTENLYLNFGFIFNAKSCKGIIELKETSLLGGGDSVTSKLFDRFSLIFFM